MSLLCRFGIHQWKKEIKIPNSFINSEYAIITRHCIKCEKLQKATVLLRDPFPPVYEDVIKNINLEARKEKR